MDTLDYSWSEIWIIYKLFLKVYLGECYEFSIQLSFNFNSLTTGIKSYYSNIINKFLFSFFHIYAVL